MKIAASKNQISEAEEMKVKITLDNQVHYATLADNPSARSLFQQLPFTLPLEDYAASEKIARPQFKLNTAEAPARYRSKPGDITYYTPWGNLALFYKGSADADGLIYLGKFDGDYSALNHAKTITVDVAA